MNADNRALPICVGCDGTVVRTNTLLEGMLRLFKESIRNVVCVPLWLLRGKANLKGEIASRSEIEVDRLPYNEEFVRFLRQEHAAGRKLVLVSSAHELVARRIADHLGLFSHVFATNQGANITGRAKQELLCREFGEKGYVYAGSHYADAPAWRSAKKAIVVNADRRLSRYVGKLCELELVLPRRRSRFASYLKALRPHQWLKNLLVFVPIFVAHQVSNPGLAFQTVLAAACFCACASSAYLTNDLLDLASDRRHPRKRARPFASGDLPLGSGVVTSLLLIVAAAIGALFLNPLFQLILATYYVSTLTYSIDLKHRPVVDVLVLAGLYTIRLLGGAAATHIRLSFWLLAFSVFLFFSLALVKRYAELLTVSAEGNRQLHGRGYATTDLAYLAHFGQSSGLIAVLVLALYVNSPEVALLYRRPVLLWLVLPPMLYWICRVWLKAHRGQMHDDPLVFAATDRPSLLAGIIVLGIVAVATVSAV